MPDEEGNLAADEETLPKTPLHAYGQGRTEGEGREEDVEGDVEKLKSGDPQQLQRDDIEDEESSSEHIEPPPKA
jgi:hypothetical protein